MKLVQSSLQQVVAVAGVAMLVALPNLANAQQRVVPAQSEIAFVSKQFGVPVGGKFKKFDAEVTFDPKKVEAAKVNFNVDLLSADIGNSETEAELKKPGWFNSQKMPQANFTSTAVKAIGGGKFEFSGKLSIKGISQNVVVPVTLTQSAGVTRAVGSFTLKRLDFKIGDGEWNDVSLVANEVVVNIKLALTGVPPL
ncbi:MAG: YceI family protein [Burkholderiales bacterium]|jgi:polyisoprenoid-binding protein YceI|nr:YceI family protein [Rhodocyclaceae bacterium]MCA3021540.1 YceI family protein [Rhodocyclaceae bacterium]MCA3054291.1 YceI family protein [Rhodocyclaceae bacterium]MCE2722687.1 YceI family protein [Betaproteobacteria bacterium]